MIEDLLTRVWENLAGRVEGPLKLRLLVQPAVAATLAIRAGLADARGGRPAYFWAVLTDASQRRRLLREGWQAVAKVFVLAAGIDLVYQWIAIRRLYPGEALLVALLLAALPYLLLRGPVNRLARARRGKGERTAE